MVALQVRKSSILSLEAVCRTVAWREALGVILLTRAMRKPGFIFWYACPTTSEAGYKVPSLFYGVEVQKQNLPSEECKQINIQARFA